MNKVLKKFKTLIGMNDESNLLFNQFIIGRCNYYVFEIQDNNHLVKHEILDIIIKNQLKFYWFRSYYELERYGDLIIAKEDYIFIIIC